VNIEWHVPSLEIKGKVGGWNIIPSTGDMNRVVHFEIHVDDIDRAKKFYTDVFGWTLTQMGEEYGNYVLVMTGPSQNDLVGKPARMEDMGINGGMMKRNAEKAPAGSSPNSYVCVIGVTDTDQVVTKVTDAGGSVHMPAMDIPNVGRVAYLGDTEGNIFGVITPVQM
jgi:uncharacterized protein